MAVNIIEKIIIGFMCGSYGYLVGFRMGASYFKNDIINILRTIKEAEERIHTGDGE